MYEIEKEIVLLTQYAFTIQQGFLQYKLYYGNNNNHRAVITCFVLSDMI